MSFDSIKSQSAKSEVAATQSSEATSAKDEGEDFTVPTWLRKNMR